MTLTKMTTLGQRLCRDNGAIYSFFSCVYKNLIVTLQVKLKPLCNGLNGLLAIQIKTMMIQ